MEGTSQLIYKPTIRQQQPGSDVIPGSRKAAVIAAAAAA